MNNETIQIKKDSVLSVYHTAYETGDTDTMLALAVAYGGIAFASANGASSGSNTGYGSRLSFKSEKLAVYCGQQFIDLWKDYLII